MVIDDSYLRDNGFSLTTDDIVKLTGVIGLYPIGEMCEITIIDIQSGDFKESTIVSLYCDLIDRLDVEIFHGAKVKHLTINMLLAATERQNIACKLIKAIETYAFSMGYYYVTLYAFKGLPYYNIRTEKFYPYSGYIVWGKLGFLFSDNGGKARFREVVETVDPWLEYLYELLEIPHGAKAWKIKGKSWYGHFDLRPNRMSSVILNAYIKSRGIEIPFIS